jgi:hypothetical protein
MAADTAGTAVPGQARSPQINQWPASLQPALIAHARRHGLDDLTAPAPSPMPGSGP